MALEVVPIKDANNATVNITVDDDGVGNKSQVQATAYGADGAVKTLVSDVNPMPVREPVKGSALGKGGITSSGVTQQVVATNTSRTLIDVSNGHTTGMWLAFGSSAVAGQGAYLAPGNTQAWATTAAVNVINASGGTPGPVGYTEW